MKISKQAIQEWVALHQQELIQDLFRLVRIPSVSTATDDPNAPFGVDCAQVLEEGLLLCRKYGLTTRNIAHRCGTAVWPGRTTNRIGIYNHLDVVPAGTGWDTPPFEPTVRGAFLLGRGVGDNKGPAVAALYAIRCLKDLGAQLDHSIQLYLGCSEETGMADLDYYVAHEQQPAFGLVPDVRFPLCCGEKGILSADLVRRISNSNLLVFQGGVASNSVPDQARAVLSGLNIQDVQRIAARDPHITVHSTSEGVEIQAHGIAGHAAFPQETDSAIRRLAQFLTQNKLVSGDGANAIGFLSHAFQDSFGSGLGIAFEDDISGATTHVGGMVHFEKGLLIQNINVRYAIRTDQEQMLSQLRRTVEQAGFHLENVDNDPPYFTPPDHPAVKALLQAFQDVYGGPAEPYVMGGGTYARKLKNAVGFGPGWPRENPYGGGHQPNEAIHLENLTNMVEIYANALLAIDPLVGSEVSL